MQATQVATTHPSAPYDVLRPMRCRYEFQGNVCTGRSSDIDWSTPNVHGFKCPKCKTQNVILIIEAAR